MMFKNKVSFEAIALFCDKIAMFLLVVSVFTNALFVSITSGLIVLATVLYLIALPVTRKAPRIDRRVAVAILVYFVAQLVCSVFAIYPSYSLWWSIKYVILYSLQFFLILACVNSSRQYRWTLLAWIAGIVLLDLNIIWNYLALGQGRKSVKYLLDVPITQLPDWLNCFVWPWLLAMLAKAQTERRRVAIILAIVVVACGIVLNGGRNVWMVALLQLFVFLFIMRRRKLLAAAAVAAVALAGTMLFMPMVKERMWLFADFSARTNVNRLMLWRYTLDIVRDFPITGIGNGAVFQKMFNLFYTHGFSFGERPAHAHNIVLARLAETGIIGLMAFLFFVGTILRRSWKRFVCCSVLQPLYLAGFVSLAGWLAMSMFDYSVHLSQVTRTFWIVSGLAFVNLEKTTDDLERVTL